VADCLAGPFDITDLAQPALNGQFTGNPFNAGEFLCIRIRNGGTHAAIGIAPGFLEAISLVAGNAIEQVARLLHPDIFGPISHR
jgi:hypothetical protein